jgi:probable phosphoglycerate mutase
MLTTRSSTTAPAPGPKPRWGGADETPTTLLLVRHGSTAHSLDGRFSGRNDLPLDGPGRLQARAAADAIAGLEAVDAVLSSPLRRARETAEAIAAAVGGPVEIVDDLVELDFGLWEGHSFAEAERTWPEPMARWLLDEDAAPPGGESFAAVTARVRRFLADVRRDRAHQRVVAVSHVTPINTLLRLALGAPHETIFRLHLDPASLSIVDYYADGAASVKRCNDSGHRH